MNTDDAIRQQALNPRDSFIIQAPAGSGKTELLTQRVLRLLTTVQEPEQILAITFTRKAAHEMKQRILTALNTNYSKAEWQQLSAHKKFTAQLAENVRQHAVAHHWTLPIPNHQLRIMTIDAFAGMLSRQIPITSGMGTTLKISEHPENLYKQAVYAALNFSALPEALAPAVQLLLQHLNNRLDRLVQRLIQLLPQRDCWLSYLSQDEDAQLLKEKLESSIQHIIVQQLQRIESCIPQDLKNELLQFIQFASQHLQEQTPEHPILTNDPCIQWPKPKLAHYAFWRGVTQLLLTKSGTIRKTVTKNEGFPTLNEQKRFALQILKRLQEYPAFAAALQQLQLELPLQYDPQQWELLAALFKVLPHCVAHLMLNFRQQSTVDFTEMTLAADRALGDFAEPTDLRFYLDYQIKHLLIDEFQDTSQTQYQLFSKLTQNWHADEGHSIFLVGDPMQSIYRFRNAQVGLFLRAQQQGLGGMPLTPLTLQCNFRATPALIDWCNNTFPSLFPAQADIALGAIPYAPATAMREKNAPTTSPPKPCIHYAALHNGDEAQEADAIIKIIQQLQTAHPTDTMAILVRSRTHVRTLLSSLRQAKLSVNAQDLETLSDQPLIQDLYSLTRALLHPADKLAWLSILRAPWCGITLCDLECIANYSRAPSLWLALQQQDLLHALTLDGQQRLHKMLPILQQALLQYQRLPLRLLLESTWQSLDGARCVQHESEWNLLESYWQLLESVDTGCATVALDTLQERLHQQYVPSFCATESNISIMTIHKAKGLEFDHVILSALNRSTTISDPPLFRWQQIPDPKQGGHLLLAPIHALDEQNALYRYLQQVELQQDAWEQLRLLYVAVTRAKNSLHLIASIRENEPDATDEAIEKKSQYAPRARSWLKRLWSQHESGFMSNLLLSNEPAQQSKDANHPPAVYNQPCLRRLPDIFFQNEAQLIDIPSKTKSVTHPPGWHPLRWMRQTIGTIVHETLQQLGLPESEQPKITASLYNFWQKKLKHAGIPQIQQPQLLQQIEHALKMVLHDSRGQWILQTHYQSTHNEWAVSGWLGDTWVATKLDRSFIDLTGIRWIIDYKIAEPTGEQDLLDFLHQQQQQYRPQLEKYARLVQNLEQHPICLGLYFPLCQQWIEWEFSEYCVKTSLKQEPVA